MSAAFGRPLRRCVQLLPVALVAALAPVVAQAVAVDTLTVAKNDGRYRVDLQVRLDTAADSAYAVFTRYNNLPLINPAVKEVRIESGAPDDATRVYTRMHLCFSFFCRTLEQVQDMRLLPAPEGGRVTADVIPEKSDLLYGKAQWRIGRCPTSPETCLEFHAELEPKFWIPPLIGPWLMERKLRQEAIQTSQGIERLAKAAVSASPQ